MDSSYQRVMPRIPVQSEKLVRPDWVNNQPRPSQPLWLDKNENLDPDLQRITHGVLLSLAPSVLSTYPDSGFFYRKLARHIDVKPEQLILTAGSDGVIRSVFEAFVAEGDTVIHTVPTFAMYSVYCQIFGAHAIGLEYKRTESSPQLDVDHLVSLILEHRPKLVCLPNPDSPTGTVVDEMDLDRLLCVTSEVGSVFLVDEAYYPFYSKTVVGKIAQYPNLIVARTFAKAWGVAGLRIGYAVAAEETVRDLHKIRPMYEVNTLAVSFMDRMLDHSEEMLASVRRLNQGKAYFLREMSRLGFKTLNGEGNFLHVCFGDARKRVFAALQDKVLFRADFKEPCLAGYSRFSATTRELFEPIVELIEVATLKEAIREENP